VHQIEIGVREQRGLSGFLCSVIFIQEVWQNREWEGDGDHIGVYCGVEEEDGAADTESRTEKKERAP